MKTNLQRQDETRFVELVTELFQMDEAQALDFGIYRVIRRHNQEIKSFLGDVITEKDGKYLQGGRLSELILLQLEIQKTMVAQSKWHRAARLNG